jgi:hypothetical protein
MSSKSSNMIDLPDWLQFQFYHSEEGGQTQRGPRCYSGCV